MTRSSPHGGAGSTKPRLLDAYCGAGGVTKGFQRAGFFVVGVDHKAQPNYCGEAFERAEAMEVLERLLDGGRGASYRLEDFAAIHASPPCLGRSNLKAVNRHIVHVDLVAPTRELLLATGLPYVIENVEGDMSGSPLIEPVTICGSSLGLDVRRHRLFETNWPLMVPPCAHGWQEKRFDVYEHGKWRKSPTVPVYGKGGRKAKAHWAEAMGIDWMTHDEMAQAIPPAYTELIGHQLMQFLNAERQAA